MIFIGKTALYIYIQAKTGSRTLHTLRLEKQKRLDLIVHVIIVSCVGTC